MRCKFFKSVIVAISLFSISTLTFADNGDSSQTKEPEYQFTQPFKCAGTEPFWSLDMSDKEFKYHSPEPVDLMMNPVKPRGAQGMKDSYLRVYETTIQDNNKPVTIIVKDNPNGCTDGMSDENHGYDAIVILPDRVVSGCCDRVYENK